MIAIKRRDCNAHRHHPPSPSPKHSCNGLQSILVVCALWDLFSLVALPGFWPLCEPHANRTKGLPHTNKGAEDEHEWGRQLRGICRQACTVFVLTPYPKKLGRHPIRMTRIARLAAIVSWLSLQRGRGGRHCKRLPYRWCPAMCHTCVLHPLSLKHQLIATIMDNWKAPPGCHMLCMAVGLVSARVFIPLTIVTGHS
jgi:hypothetical protein